MRKLIIVVLFTALATVGICQDTLSKKVNKIGVGINLLITGSTEAFDMAPYISYNSLRHKIALGPIIGKTPIRKFETDYGGYLAYSTHSESTGIVGATLSYQFLPNPPAKIFDLYFENRLSYVLQKTEINYTDIRNLHSFENISGFGMKIKFLKRFAFQVGISVGALFKTSNDNYYNTIPLYKPIQFSGGLISGLEISF